MNFFKIPIKGEQFQKAYLVYIVKVTRTEKGSFYYVGQTGDRNHKTARPAFRRLAAHLCDQGHSTENQIYRALAQKVLRHDVKEKKKFEDNVKIEMSDFLMQSEIELFAYAIKTYNKAPSTHDHHCDRKYVELIEKDIINYFREKYGDYHLLDIKLPPVNTGSTQAEAQK